LTTAAAFFDVDGTLTRTTLLHPLIWNRRANLNGLRFALWSARLLLAASRYPFVDWCDRSRFNVLFYRRYAGLDAAALGAWHRRTFAENLQKRLLAAGQACVREHLHQGRHVVLVTGGLDLVMRPLAECLDVTAMIATRLVEEDGVFTGAIDGPPIADGHKAQRVRAHAQEHDIDLSASFAYGDSHGDLPLLECVGHPVAVNPDRKLRRTAVGRRWPVVNWSQQSENGHTIPSPTSGSTIGIDWRGCMF
jgi:HAD superfamily hydrolase (TIGR01490 family)